LNLASGQIQGVGGNGAEVIVAKPKGSPIVAIFTDSNANGTVFDVGEPIFDTLLPGGPGHKSGATVAAGDTDNSGTFVEVITAPGAGRGNTIRIFDDSADMGAFLSDDTPLSFEAFSDTFKGGINIAFGKVRSETYAMSGFPRSIPDSNTLQDTIIVPADAGVIQDVDISLNIFHSFDDDLEVTLVHVPTGKAVVLFTDVGGTNEGFFIRLNDEAGTDISTASNSKLDGAISGTFNPEGTAMLSVFDGDDASGEWRLIITDDVGGDTGTLFSWSLHISY
jgi:subtilisin-like proprotein convertase family protein